MDASNKLRLLAWKYRSFCKYHWFMTALQFLLPILITYIMTSISEQFIVDRTNITIDAEVEDRTRTFILAYQNYKTIFYCPISDHIDEVIRAARESTTHFLKDEIQKNPKFVAQVDENEMIESINKNTTDEVAGIVFLKLTNQTLEYKIRDKHTWNTAELFIEAESEQSGPYGPDPYFTAGFAALQSAINVGYTRWLMHIYRGDRSVYWYATPKRPYQQAYYQPLPYPDYVMQKEPLRNFLPLIAAFIVVVTSLLLTGPLISAIITEKETGIKKWLLIAGLEERLIWLSWFLHSLFIGVFSYSFVTYLLIIDFDEPLTAILRFTDISLIWACIILFIIAQISFSFMFCAIFHSVANSTASFTMTTLVVAYIAYQVHVWHSPFLVHLSCFVPSGAFIQAFIRIGYYELLGQSLIWRSVFKNEVYAADASVGFALVLLIIDTFLYLFLTYYISGVNPGRYGSRKPWNFPFQFSENKNADLFAAHERVGKKEEKPGESKNFEPPSAGAIVTLDVKDLSKKYGYVEAVKDINFVANANEILVILGHNGAGKTTTLSMLTGFTQPTSGTIFFKGSINIFDHTEEYRERLGVCPQENRLFHYLTVLDHLMFYGKLKGADPDDILEEALGYLSLVDMYEKAEELPSALSTAMQRKLCLLISLMGKAEILILDEPTAGVDDLSKDKIWDLLLKLKQGRTIIVTTHVMKEANQIADKIAILSHGSIVCNGSVDFLKKTFGAGYQLKLIRKKQLEALAKGAKDNTQTLIDLVTRAIVGSKLESRRPTELAFFLPQGNTSKFPALFQALENGAVPLNIEAIRVDHTTLDHIFLKVGGQSVYDTKGKLIKDFSRFDDTVAMKPLKPKLKGSSLFLQQNLSLLTKKNSFILRNVMTFVSRVIIPTLLVLSLIRVTRRFEQYEPELTFDVLSYPGAITLLARNNATNVFELYTKFGEVLLSWGQNIIYLAKDDTTSGLLKYASESITRYRRDVLLAFDLNVVGVAPEWPPDIPDNETIFTPNFFLAFYNKWFRHSLPTAINTVDNTLLYYYFESTDFHITTINHPLEKKYSDVSPLASYFSLDFAEQKRILAVWFVIIGFFTVDLLDYFIIPLKIERIDGFKHIQFLSGVSPLLYWVNTFVYDFVMLSIIVIIRLLCCKTFDSYGFFTGQTHMVVIFLLLVLFIISGLLFVYDVSFIQHSKNGSYIFFFTFNLACVFVAFAFYTWEADLISGSLTTFKHFLMTILKYVILLIPPLNFFLACQKVLWGWRENHGGTSNTARRKRQFNDKSYMQYASNTNPNGIKIEVIFLILDILIYAALLYCIESGFLDRLIHRPKKEKKTTPPPQAEENSIRNSGVFEEHSKVDELAKTIATKPEPTNAVVVKGLKRTYRRLVRPTITAVSDLSFVVSTNECFGILGREGAGKTTTCKILTGIVRPTAGESWVLNADQKKNKKNRYLSNIGYCPEINSFLEELTGRETLELIATLRGIDKADHKVVVEKWISTLDLEAAQNKQTITYSGGNRRKLCLAMSLIVDPEVLILDEATAGVDPISRRKFYQVIGRSKRAGQAVVIASHSVAECEALCDRITVLVKGEMRFIGSIEELRTKYAEGFSLHITLHKQNDKTSDDIRDIQVEAMQRALTDKFVANACILKDKTKTTLYYHIKQKLKWSDAFQRMEEVKTKQKIIIEYLLVETSLDEVFLSFYEDLQ